ncbi:hypothetical protein PsorP6_016555 [Peronosclerospora sorghi]|uniref:Uncharacterized protein n=1 Tax=Peronosclerospora sorghi TaxID=230839 RepID=A0ACC0VLU8_9STRA|nr:hypothetical protein PsorP6_016555 [Peronosclerospora sorghi]
MVAMVLQTIQSGENPLVASSTGPIVENGAWGPSAQDTGSNWKLYHVRQGHSGHDAYVRTQPATTGLPEIKKPSYHLCGGCAKGKITVAPFHSESKTKKTQPLEIVHTDLIGLMGTRSAGGSRYVGTFVDD